MFRLLGFLIGSAASIGVMLLFLGVPELHLSNPQLDKGRFDEALEKLRHKAQSVDSIARETTEKLSAALEKVAEPAPDTTEAPVQPDPEPVMMTQIAKDDVPLIADDSRIAAPVAIAQIEHDLHWHAFWNPFRSRIAADGFVSQLEKVTGLDYRVVKVNTGLYEVAFAYEDDSERRNRLSQISAATGLELPVL